MQEIDAAKENFAKHFKFNLTDLVKSEFDVFAARFRISSMKVLLLDANQQVLYHHSDFAGKDETVQIKFPKIFYDRDINRKKLQFRMGKAHTCLSSYYNKSEKNYRLFFAVAANFNIKFFQIFLLKACFSATQVGALRNKWESRVLSIK